MIVHSIELEHWRSYGAVRAEFDPDINVITGDNAQGKTNLLEAIAYLSACRSHRARTEGELIRIGESRAAVRGALTSRNREFLLEVKLGRGIRRQMFSNGVRQKTVAEMSGILKTVLFCPEDLNLIRAGAVERRRFLDDAICQLRPRYAAALSEYKRLLDQKRRILKDWPEKPSLLELLDDFNLRLCQTGALVIHYRAHFIKKLAEYAPPIHGEFSSGREALSLRYQTVKTVTDPLAPTQVLFQQFQEHMEGHRRAELDSKSCLSGPHKDDLLLNLNGVSVRTYGSQGQTRTAALSLELAEREIFFENDGEYPVLLLDDVLSELDPRRQEFVLNRIRGGQVFITCCENERLTELKAGKVLHIDHGTLVEEQR
jgi:DNA replication and repair protein RecF